MATKKQNKNGSGNIFFLFGASGAVVLIIALLFSMLPGEDPIGQLNKNKSPVLSSSDQARSFIVTAINQDGYQARDANSNEEVKIIMPASAEAALLAGPIIKVGNIFVLTRYIEAANGLIAQKMQVLPPVPNDKPSLSLPNNPNE